MIRWLGVLGNANLTSSSSSGIERRLVAAPRVRYHTRAPLSRAGDHFALLLASAAASPRPRMVEFFAPGARPGIMAKELFGTDGIRGIPGEPPLDDATLDRVGGALGEYLRAHGPSPRVLIGMDTRESGPHIARRIARGLISAGAEPVAAGVLTTPGVAWLGGNEGFAAGVVISASHNPYHDNGVKLVSSSGMKFPDAVEAEIERAMSGLAPLDGPVSDIRSETARDLHEDYLRALQSAAFEGAHFAGMK